MGQSGLRCDPQPPVEAVVSRRPGDKRIIGAAVWFWHNASDDDIGTVDDEWCIVDGWSPAPGYYTTIVRRYRGMGWRFADDIQMNFHDYWGGEVAVESVGNEVAEVCFFNGRTPHQHGRRAGHTYDDQGLMIWKRGESGPDRTKYTSNFNGRGAGDVPYESVPKKIERPKRPEGFGSWS